MISVYLSDEEVKEALLIQLFARTGMRLQITEAEFEINMKNNAFTPDEFKGVTIKVNK